MTQTSEQSALLKSGILKYHSPLPPLKVPIITSLDSKMATNSRTQ